MRRELSVREAADGEGRLYPMRLSVWAPRALTRLMSATAKYQIPGPSSRRKVGLGLGRAWRRAVPAEVGPRTLGSRSRIAGRRSGTKANRDQSRMRSAPAIGAQQLGEPTSRNSRGWGLLIDVNWGFVGHSKPADVGWNFHYYCEKGQPMARSCSHFCRFNPSLSTSTWPSADASSRSGVIL